MKVVGVKGMYAQWVGDRAPPHPAVWHRANDYTSLGLSLCIC